MTLTDLIPRIAKAYLIGDAAPAFAETLGDAPHVIAAFNVIATDDQADAERQQHEMMRSRVALLLRPGTEYTDEQADELLASPQAHHLHQMATYSAVGTPDVVKEKVTEFAEQTGADELIIAHQFPGVEGRLRSVRLTAEAMETVAA